MIINSESAAVIRTNAARLAGCVRTKEDLADLATAATFDQVFSAIESILSSTEMYFDDELLCMLNEESWKAFKAVLLVYTMNGLNRTLFTARAGYAPAADRSFGATHHL